MILSWFRIRLTKPHRCYTIYKKRQKHTHISLSGQEVQQLSSYKYLGHEIHVGLDSQTVEFQRRIGFTWAAFGNLKASIQVLHPGMFKEKNVQSVCSACYDIRTGNTTLTRQSINKLPVTQRSLRDRIQNNKIRRFGCQENNNIKMELKKILDWRHTEVEDDQLRDALMI